MSARIWTQEQRQRQSEAIRRWKPWEQSTGPKSERGKARSSGNAYTGGEMIQMRQWVKKMKEVLSQQRKYLTSEEI